MLKRNDLVKEFSLLVQQEIKNHNNSIALNNERIAKIENDFQKQKEKTKLEHNHLISEISNKDIQLKNLSHICEDLKRQIKELTVNINISNNLFSKKQDELLILIEQMSKHIDDMEINFSDLKFEQKKLYSESLNLELKLQEKLNNYSKKITEENKKYYEILNTKPCHLEKEINELSNKFSILNVNLTGLIAENDINKKKIFIQEKHIEKLNILILRLKQEK